MPHTPGEWELVELEGKLDDWTGARFVIRQPQHAPGGVAAIIGGVGIEEERANARLVAASGKLLNALNGVMGLLQLLMSRSDVPDEVKASYAGNHRWRYAQEILDNLAERGSRR